MFRTGNDRKRLLAFSIAVLAIYIDKMMGEAMEEIKEGIKVGVQVIADVRFADDQTMIASTEKGL